jgi:hypothetical protein
MLQSGPIFDLPIPASKSVTVDTASLEKER